jgi:molybdopterin synthase catalytic subunit
VVPPANMPIITERTLDLDALKSLVAAANHGAVVTFEGVVRGDEAGAPIRAIVYEAYASMAEQEIARISEEAGRRWSVAVSVQHRVGRVAVGEASLCVAVGGRHRREAFEAMVWAIDRIKGLAPIWKTTYERSPA